MPISPGPATNAAMAQNVQHEQRATTSEASGKITEPTKGSNASSAAHSFELKVANDPGH